MFVGGSILQWKASYDIIQQAPAHSIVGGENASDEGL
eukprot:CAMPEP_0113715196 /NCGR_PEP_ID=MMETSP0038_2-20120614/33118_1 /TAXON_ID=2898 /ORGANISM="Cryptomonas paramecium" /LENGTH=36 /DNA_ID=CAMNT_0000642417 /DNA_START=53 /DNA_END=160 /DNA_ORIENTATION=- /assembly_acc=CAM_ASM_000170